MKTTLQRVQPMSVLLGAAAVIAACATGQPDNAPQPASGATPDLEALYWARLDSATMRFTDADVRFVTGMIGHHAQALVMAGFTPSRGASPSIEILSARIINAQKDEIALMQRWLSDRGQLVPEVHITGSSLMIHGPADAMQMPGMLTPLQMDQLEQAMGTEFDRLFLTYMIQHHRGAVTMVHALLATDGAAQDEAVFKLASDIQVDQLTEIARMEQMLKALPANRDRQ